jgi:4-hydroxythreonine-4-phosphate dehydrogenase
VRGHALADALREAHSRGIACVVCDTETDEDLRAIATAGRTLESGVVWVGSGGLAHAIAATLRAPAGMKPAGYDDSKSPAATRPMLVVVGSRSAIAREQAAALVDNGIRRIVVPADRLAAAADAWTRDVVHALERGQDVLVGVGDGPTQVEDDATLMARLGEALRSCAALAGSLVVTGGDTAIGVLSAWGASGLRLIDELEPGIVLSSAIGLRPLAVVTKSGSFGDRGALVRVRGRLRKDA